MRVPYLRSFVVAVLALAGVGAGIQLVRAQTLAEVARKEEERRKTIREPAKVYTNKDLSAAPPGSPPAPAPAKTGDDAKDAKDDEKEPKAKGGPQEPAKNQAYWATRMKTLQAALDRDQTFAAAMQTQVNSLITDFINRDDPAQKAVIARNRDKAILDLAQLSQAIVADKKALDDLQEEARRAGVPPGWLR